MARIVPVALRLRCARFDAAPGIGAQARSTTLDVRIPY